MSHTKGLVTMAGLALGLGAASALAQSANQDRAYLAELVADAQDRTSLSAAEGGHDGLFHLQSASGDYRLNIEGQLQFRYNANFRDNPNETAQSSNFDDFETGFQTRRTKLFFSGNVYNENLTFMIVGDFGGNEEGNDFQGRPSGGFAGGGTFTLRDAWVRYQLDNGIGIGWGQFKLPILREETVDSRYQLLADRSLTNEVFNQDYSQGVWLDYTAEDWRTVIAFSDGIRTANTDFNSAAEADYALTGRFEWKWAGDWDRFNDFTSFRGSEYAGELGAAIHFQESPNTNFAGETNTQLLLYTVDATVEGDGWNLYAAFIGQHVSGRAGGGDTPNIDNFGAVVQGGIFVTDDIEVFARYDIIIPDDSTFSADTFSTITGGANYYFIPESHAAKLTADVQVFLDDESEGAPFVAGDITGINRLSDVSDSQVAFRLQFQLLF